MKFLICLFLTLSCFGYDLHLTTIPGTNSRTMVCFHGYGANYQIANRVKGTGIESTLVSFNFPEHDLINYNPHNASLGTFRELIPAFTVLKKYVIDEGLDSIDLYGFSAGGGALINLIAALNTPSRDAELMGIGIGADEKEKLLKAIQNGIIILDAPLKSVEEIMYCRGPSSEFKILAKHYRDNNSRPIDSVSALKGLSLNILLYLEIDDEVLSNRDDAIYIERLKEANALGTTEVIIEKDGGHKGQHSALWKATSSVLKVWQPTKA